MSRLLLLRVGLHLTSLLLVIPFLSISRLDAAGQERAGRLVGTVTLQPTGEALHNVGIVVIGAANRATVTGDDGRYVIEGLTPGEHTVLAQREHLSDQQRTVTILAGETTTVDFALTLSGVHEHVTVTASPAGATTTFQAFNAVTVLDSFEMAKNMSGSIGQMLAELPGVAERTFGPGSSRPIIRGFDGDRVLVMQDGVRTGDLSSQSGDHGVTIDPGSLERLEVVRGPASLLYGSNAVGGVVNAITPQEAYRTRPFEGLVGQTTADFGTTNGQAGGNASVQFSHRGWLVWGGGGSRRTGDYGTPEGEVENSGTRLTNGRAGLAYFGNRPFFSIGYQTEDGRYGVPYAGESHAHGDESEDHDDETAGHGPDEALLVDLSTRRHSLRFDGGVRNLDNTAIESVRVIVNYLDWRHDEIEAVDDVEELGTRFDNEVLVIRAEADQKRVGRLSGRFGVWSQFRDYIAAGEEALSPPTEQRSFAAFGYEEVDFGGARLQFGARVEHNGYETTAREEEEHEGHDHAVEPPEVKDRGFTGLSASVGVHVDIGTDSAFVGTLTRSYRAPALEELYNFGPHAGNQLFEIGNPDLEREAATSFDVSLRHRGERVRGEVNVYYYDIDDFVFPALTGEEEEGLLVAQYLQGDSRFVGVDARGEFRLHDAVRVNLGAGYVDAQLTETGQALPRIPPFRVTLGADLSYRRLTVTPELVLASEQDQIYGTETPTDGYTLLNLGATYLWPQRHVTHQFSLQAFNLTNELYRNHTSFIKDRAPEIGRGVKIVYAMRFF